MTTAPTINTQKVTGAEDIPATNNRNNDSSNGNNDVVSFNIVRKQPISPEQWHMLSTAISHHLSADLEPNQVRIYTVDDEDAQALVNMGLFKYVREWIDPHDEEFKDDLRRADWTHKVYQATATGIGLCWFMQFVSDR